MKKLLVLCSFVALAASSAFAGSDDWQFESTLGPSIGVHNAAHNFMLEPRIGKEYIKGGLGMYFGNLVAFRPHVAVDLPFYLSLANSDDFIIGPTFDAGLLFNFKTATSIDFFNLGFGLKTAYKFSDTFGVIFVPVHFMMSFVQWVSGVGTGTGFAMTYDIKFGVFLTL